MKLRKSFVSVISLCGLWMVTGTAAWGGLAWYGFSGLNFEYTGKGGSGDGELTITPTQVTMKVKCRNIQTGEITCHNGRGNGNDLPVSADVLYDAIGKDKGTITAEGAYPLSPFEDPEDEHYVGCHPDANKNKEVVAGSAFVITIEDTYILTQKGKKKMGVQKCAWGGDFNEITCEPEHGAYFHCPIDTEFNVNGHD